MNRTDDIPIPREMMGTLLPIFCCWFLEIAPNTGSKIASKAFSAMSKVTANSLLKPN